VFLEQQQQQQQRSSARVCFVPANCHDLFKCCKLLILYYVKSDFIIEFAVLSCGSGDCASRCWRTTACPVVHRSLVMHCNGIHGPHEISVSGSMCELLANYRSTALVAWWADCGLIVLLMFAHFVGLQVIMQMFHWTRNPSQAAKIAQRKEEIYDSIMNGVQPAEVPGVRSYLDTLRNYNVSARV
jgi:hypothetical protein